MRDLSRQAVRIATWNLERPKPRSFVRNQARIAQMNAVNADIWVLTETHESLALSYSSPKTVAWMSK